MEIDRLSKSPALLTGHSAPLTGLPRGEESVPTRKTIRAKRTTSAEGRPW